jgi:hypothetical protein
MSIECAHGRYVGEACEWCEKERETIMSVKRYCDACNKLPAGEVTVTVGKASPLSWPGDSHYRDARDLCQDCFERLLTTIALAVTDQRP